MSGKPVDESILEEFGFVAPGLSGDEKEDGFTMRGALKDFYNTLDHAARLNMITRFLRIAEWDSRDCVVKVGREDGQERMNDTTGQIETPVYNRIQGFHALDDRKRGAGYVRQVCHPKQLAYAIDAGLIEAPEGTAAGGEATPA